jgi:signal recognition particle receptor subunit beta
MPTTKPNAREIDCKVVYYGPAASGKTTNLRYVHGRLDPATRSELIAPTTDGDKTLFFDFVAVDMGMVGEYRTRFHLFTVPGQVRSNDTRLVVLRGVDGIIFVADSSADRLDANAESLHNLEQNLAAIGVDISALPCVVQYNKRDLAGALSVNELEAALNPGGLPAYEAVAINGRGVLETLTAISKQVITALG